MPMSMQLRIVQSVILPRLLMFGAELYGMNRSLSDQMQTLQTWAVRTVLGMKRMTRQVSSVGLWLESRIPPICVKAAGWRARPYQKGKDLKTWLQGLISQPFSSCKWTWASGVPQWIKRFTLKHATPEIQAEYLGDCSWELLPPDCLKLFIQSCILQQEHDLVH